MSALGQKRTCHIGPKSRNVRYSPESGHLIVGARMSETGACDLKSRRQLSHYLALGFFILQFGTHLLMQVFMV
jgi:hypothetical protein